MESPPLKWQAHDAPGYDRTMSERCSKLLEEIVADPARRRAILTTPQKLHQELFASFVPPGHDEYAGTFRGTPNTALANREPSSASALKEGESYPFCPSVEVAARMGQLLEEVQGLLDDKNSEKNYNKLLALAYAFCWFGKIHPFLDGNGHIQRALFAALATEFGYPLSPRFAIHPRPYDRLFGIALEVFARAPAGKEAGELAVAAEYLAFFLEGPFHAPRKNVGPAPLYT